MTAHVRINSKEFEKKIKRKIKGLQNRRSYYAQAVVIVDRWIIKNFETEGQAVGGWQPLADSTLLARQRGYGDYVKSSSPRILQNKRDLKGKWKHMSTARFAKIQSGVEYGKAHNYGYKHIPKRQILPDEKHVMPKLKKLLGLWIRKVFK